MKSSCTKCQAGPKEIGGHEDLYVHSFVGPTVVMKCRACDSFWTRSHPDNSTFEWIASLGTQGMLVPSG